MPFHTFMYDCMIMRYGLQSIAIKTLIQLTNGLNFEKKSPFAHTLSNMIGMAVPPFRLDEVQIVLRSHLFFKMAQENWIARIKKMNNKAIEVTREDESNLKRGGNCSVFDLLEELKVALVGDKVMQERILTSLKPDVLLQASPNRAKLSLRYSILKVTNKIAKMGKDPKWVYKQFDKDGNGTCKYHKTVLICSSNLGVCLSFASGL